MHACVYAVVCVSGDIFAPCTWVSRHPASFASASDLASPSLRACAREQEHVRKTARRRTDGARVSVHKRAHLLGLPAAVCGPVTGFPITVLGLAMDGEAIWPVMLLMPHAAVERARSGCSPRTAHARRQPETRQKTQRRERKRGPRRQGSTAARAKKQGKWPPEQVS